MFTKILSVSFLSMGLVSTALAKGHHGDSGEFYIVTKALMTTSQSVHEGAQTTLESQIGGGLGVDLGYTLPHNFALELDTSYSQNSVKESAIGEHHHESVDAMAKYWTYAFDVTYTYSLSHSFGLMGKVGYEFEHESIEKLHIEGDESGLVYGGAVEYHLSEHYDALFEYEQSTIESPRGASLYAGLKYIF